MKPIKANTSRWLFDSFPDLEQEMGRRTLWSRGYYARAVGDVKAEFVRAYIARQREHHELELQNARCLASFQPPSPEPFLDLRPFSHCVAKYNCHLVCCPIWHVPAIDAAHAEGLVAYLLQVGKAKHFDILSLAVMDDHVHLFAALRPDQSPEFLALAVMNNSSHWLSQHNPAAAKWWNAPGFCTPSAFVRTAGAAND